MVHKLQRGYGLGQLHTPQRLALYGRREGGREGEREKEAGHNWRQQLTCHTHDMVAYPGGVAGERVVHATHHNILVQPQQTARLGAQWNTILWSSTPTGREQWL